MDETDSGEVIKGMTAALQQETEVFCEKQISAEMTEGRQRGG
jgi:hypothetical protein